MIPLSSDDFAGFFREVHGYPPFPWQTRLLHSVAETGRWPGILDLPTGSGKTAALDVALFHLALHADQGPSRKAPVRIVFVVDRRLVVDDAFERAKALERSLEESKEGSPRSITREDLTSLIQASIPDLSKDYSFDREKLKFSIQESRKIFIESAKSSASNDQTKRISMGKYMNFTRAMPLEG